MLGSGMFGMFGLECLGLVCLKCLDWNVWVWNVWNVWIHLWNVWIWNVGNMLDPSLRMFEFGKRWNVDPDHPWSLAKASRS